MSSAGTCPALLDHHLENGKPEQDLQSAMRLLTGEPIHDFYRGILRDAYGDDFGDAELEVSLDIGLGPPLVGHIDGFIKSLDAIVEVKTVGMYSYQMIEEKMAPFDAHVAQTNLYAAAKKCSKILFIYHNRDSGNYLTLLVDASPDSAKQTIEKFVKARRGEKTPRPYHNPDMTPCSYCELKATCYKDFASQVASGSSSEVTAETMTPAAGFINARNARLHSEKEQETHKNALVQLMGEKSINKLTFGYITLELRVGKTGIPSIAVKESK